MMQEPCAFIPDCPGARARPSMAAPPKVVTTTEDLAALAREVGGDKVTVESMAQGLPGSALRRTQAELHPQAARRRSAGGGRPRARDRLAAAAAARRAATRRSRPGSPGYLDASTGVRILEIPTGQITRAMGDVHPSGNPHYWLDPDNGRIIAKSIAGRTGADRRRPTRPTSISATRTSIARLTDGAEALGRGDGALQGHQGRHLPSLVAELRRAVRPRRDRLRRAEAGHSAVAVAHHRPDRAR